MILKYLAKKFEVEKEDPETKAISCFFLFAISILPLIVLLSTYPKSIPIWMTILAGLVLMEILFWISPIDNKKLSTKKLNKKQKKKTFSKTIRLKLDCLYTVFLLFTLVSGIIAIILKLTIETLLMALKIAGYIVGGIVAIGLIIFILYLWIKLNERKFKK